MYCLKKEEKEDGRLRLCCALNKGQPANKKLLIGQQENLEKVTQLKL